MRNDRLSGTLGTGYLTCRGRVARHTCTAPWRGSDVWLRLHLPAAYLSPVQAPPQPEVNSTQVPLRIHLPTVQVRHAGWHRVICSLHCTVNHAWIIVTIVCDVST